jgi:hypothetical protein
MLTALILKKLKGFSGPVQIFFFCFQDKTSRANDNGAIVRSAIVLNEKNVCFLLHSIVSIPRFAKKHVFVLLSKTALAAFVSGYF